MVWNLSRLFRAKNSGARPQARVINDEVSGWLEDHLRQTLETSRREFLWQYLVIYDRWAQFHAKQKDLDDQDSLSYLIEAANDALRAIAATKPTRLTDEPRWLATVSASRMN